MACSSQHMLLCVIALIAVIVHNGWSFSSSVVVQAFC